MEKILIKYYNLAADYMGTKEEYREIPDGINFDQLLVILSDENSSFRKLALNGDGKISSRVRIFRNGKIVTDLEEKLFQGDEINVFPAVSGGCEKLNMIKLRGG